MTIKNYGSRVAEDRAARRLDPRNNNDRAIDALERAQTRADQRLAERDIWEARARRADRGWHDCRDQLQNLRQAIQNAGGNAGPEPLAVPRLEDDL